LTKLDEMRAIKEIHSNGKGYSLERRAYDYAGALASMTRQTSMNLDRYSESSAVLLGEFVDNRHADIEKSWQDLVAARDEYLAAIQEIKH
jgi:hypothetical protein